MGGGRGSAMRLLLLLILPEPPKFWFTFFKHTQPGGVSLWPRLAFSLPCLLLSWALYLLRWKCHLSSVSQTTDGAQWCVLIWHAWSHVLDFLAQSRKPIESSNYSIANAIISQCSGVRGSQSYTVRYCFKRVGRVLGGEEKLRKILISELSWTPPISRLSGFCLFWVGLVFV